MTDLGEAARAIFASGKGLLAADESVKSANARLKIYGIPETDEMRHADRELFLSAPGIEKYLSGVILFEETWGQKGADGKLYRESLAARGIAPGIKVDLGTEPFPESPQELITNGLLGLTPRLQQYKKDGAVFTKWRAVITIDGDALPSAAAVHENMRRLASYARCAQEAGLVPILEPEVLLAGNHSRKRARDVITTTLSTLFSVLEEHAVDVGGAILKSSMALSGSTSGKHDSNEEVAEDTLGAFAQSVPKNLAGIVFLSGGQSPDQACDNLAAISKLAKKMEAPWPLTFSYARALQEEALSIWRGKAENVASARDAYLSRLKRASEALG